VAGRDKRAATPSSAKNFIKAMRGFFQWCIDAGLIKTDPTADVKVVIPRTEGFQIWTDEDITVFRAKWPYGTRERVAFEVLYGTGLRRSDAVKIGRPHLKDGVIRVTTEKTKERVAVVVSPEFLTAVQAPVCGELTFIADFEPFIQINDLSKRLGNFCLLIHIGFLARRPNLKQEIHSMSKAIKTLITTPCALTISDLRVLENNERSVSDSERAATMLEGIKGKRLTYRIPNC
jgi:site-specific recombinase XerD